jgi:nitrogen regulatory protein PII 1
VVLFLILGDTFSSFSITLTNLLERVMVMVRAIVRPEKAEEVMAALMADGFPAVTRMNVSGRGKQRGIKIGEVTYDEIPKELLLMVIKDTDKNFVVKKIIEVARTGRGSFGDGKIFVSPVDEVYTVSSGIKEEPGPGDSAPIPEEKI